ncbi:MAG: DUF2259 domain-containing protein [Proteobacteria bacterium]|nr:MAG: DUF2259 domain-containing protein [Pseudomonadota bacterium]
MNFKVLGFSKDNKTVAIADTVVQDGSGNGFARVSVINVAKNSIITTVTGRDGDEESGSEEKALRNALAKLDLAKYGIVAGKNLGKTLVDRLPTDHSNVTNTVFSTENWAEGGASAILPKYELAIASKPAAGDCDVPAMGMKLTLSAKEGKTTPINKVLQEDSSTLPKTRECAYGYSVSKVVKSGSALLVAVRFSSPGFEGPTQSHIAVTTEANLNSGF